MQGRLKIALAFNNRMNTSHSPALNMALHLQGLELDERQLPGASLDLFGVSHRVASAALFLVQAGPIPEENK